MLAPDQQHARMARRDSPGPLFALALAAISLIVPLAVHLFLPVIPAVQTALGLSNAMAQLTFSIALFSMAFATLVYGSLSDRYGRRPVLLLGLALFLIGSGLCAFASSVSLLILGRVVQAVGLVAALPWFAPSRRTYTEQACSLRRSPT